MLFTQDKIKNYLVEHGNIFLLIKQRWNAPRVKKVVVENYNVRKTQISILHIILIRSKDNRKMFGVVENLQVWKIKMFYVFFLYQRIIYDLLQ